jgi:hypothetical protein
MSPVRLNPLHPYGPPICPEGCAGLTSLNYSECCLRKWDSSPLGFRMIHVSLPMLDSSGISPHVMRLLKCKPLYVPCKDYSLTFKFDIE